MTNTTLSEIIAKNKARFQKMVFEMSDDRAVMFMNLYSEWKLGEQYVEGQRVRFNEELWRVKKALVAENEPIEGEEYEKIIVSK